MEQSVGRTPVPVGKGVGEVWPLSLYRRPPSTLLVGATRLPHPNVYSESVPFLPCVPQPIQKLLLKPSWPHHCHLLPGASPSTSSGGCSLLSKDYKAMRPPVPWQELLLELQNPDCWPGSWVTWRWLELQSAS